MAQDHYAEISSLQGTVAAVARADGSVVAESDGALVLKEFNRGKTYPPVYYLPKTDVDTSRLARNEGHTTHCPIKGDASYFSLQTDDGPVDNIAWSYEDPVEDVAAIRDHLAFDGRHVDVTVKD